jgi:phosphoesterase RecJ-like protein
LNISIYKEVISFLSESENIVLSTHTNPDGDTIGSALGLYLYLKSQGYNCQIICPDSIPTAVSWMPGVEDIVIYEGHPEKVKNIIENADLIIHVDYNAIHRTGDKVKVLLENTSKSIQMLIDHHPNPEAGLKAYISDITASSTAQLVYQLLKHINPSEFLPKNVATCLYVGLMTDTGSFSYSIADEKPYLMAADLVKSGIDDKWIHEKVYSTNTLDKLKLLGYALSQKLIIVENEQWAYISLELDELNKFNHQPGDTEGLANYALSINGVQAAVLLTQRKDIIRLSFRSKGNFAVNTIANIEFEGGGHLNAAGGNSGLSMPETIEKLRNLMSQYILENNVSK